MLRIIGEVRPAIGLFENSPLLTRRGLEYILFALARMGYDAQWGVLGANQAGASHGRKRAWVLASDPNQKRPSRGNDKRSTQEGWKDADLSAEILAARPFPTNGNDIPAPHVFGGSDGMANGLERVAACGDGQVPAVVALAWHLLSNE
jgi:DNA (cytosine-5)-methyltransferase 1